MSTSILTRIQTDLICYGMSMVLILGVIGNLFVIILFARRRQNSCTIYLSASAVLNICATSLIIPINIYNIDHADPTSYSLILCKIRYYFTHTWGQLARYMTVLACIDRYILTVSNIHLQKLHRPKITRWIVGIVISFYHIFTIHLLILTTIHNERCGQFGVYNILYQIHVLIFLSLIPPILMCVFGYLAYRNIKQIYTRVRPIQKSNSDSRRVVTVHRQDRDLLVMVFIEAIIYVITLSIYPFILLEISITAYSGINKSIQHLEIESFLSTISVLFIYINCGISFYLYCFVSKPFRKDFIELLILIKHQFIA